jgi:hypothetical protein
LTWFSLLFSFVSFLLWLFCVIDTLRRQQSYLWILLLIFLPPLGTILYLVNFYILEWAGWRRMDTLWKEYSRRKELEREIQVNDIPGHRMELAQIYLNEDRYEDCLRTLKPALDEDPENLRSQFIAGKALVELGRPREAIAHLEYVIEQEPQYDFGEALLVLAVAYEHTGAPDRALEVYRKVLEKSRLTEAIVRYAYLLADTGHPDQARQEVEMLLRESAAQPGFGKRADRIWLLRARHLLHRLR